MLPPDEALRVQQAAEDLANHVARQYGTSAIAVLADALCTVMARAVVVDKMMPLAGCEQVLAKILDVVRAEAAFQDTAPKH